MRCAGPRPLVIRLVAAAAAAGAVAGAAAAQHGDRSDVDRSELPAGLEVPPAFVRSPADELATFRLQPGLAIDLVAAEPLVGDPVQAVFDAHGRLWVVEMRGYMPDVDGNGEREPTGRIAVLEDRDGDGRMDAATPFLQQLVLPRAVLPLAGGALVLAPPSLLWCRDRDGDLRADGTETVIDGFEAGLANPEHCGNGLLWALDNRIHLAGDPRMLRLVPGADGPTFVVERGAGGGQWGIAQDDRGRLYFNYNEDWLRCDLVPGRYGARHGDAAVPKLALLNHRMAPDPRVFPAHLTPGVNRGAHPGMLRDGVLQRHTAVCAPLVQRGALPGVFGADRADGPGCDGDVFVCEPAGNLLRRFVRRDRDAAQTAANAYESAEFLASTDERFRPVNLTQGPDGALYVVDMYRGVIQHRNFVTTFLRRQIEARGLAQPIGLGRIWRIRGASAPGPVRPLGDTVDALVAALRDPIGWRRDRAQQALVERGARAAVPALRSLLRDDGAPAVARRHALATLDGLFALGRDDLRRALQDGDTGVALLAWQLAAPLLAGGDPIAWSLAAAIAASSASPACLRWQLALTLGDVLLDSSAERAIRLQAELVASTPDDVRLLDAVADGVVGQEPRLLQALCGRRVAASSPPLLRRLGRGAAASRDARQQQAMLQQVAACMDSAAQAAVLQGMLDALPPDPAKRRGWFVFAATPPALAAIVGTGAPEVTGLVHELLAATELRAEALRPAATADDGRDLSPVERARVEAGGAVFGAYCAACHQPDLRGMAGLAPPLRGSEWVLGPPERLIRIALHGLRGPITAAGTAFDGEMPGQMHLGDDDLAAALSWLRRAFEHRAGAIDPAAVAAVRAAGRDGPWTAAELDAR